MAAINFPDSPSTDDEYTVGSVTWKWDGSVWKSLGMAMSTGPTGATGPTGPLPEILNPFFLMGV